MAEGVTHSFCLICMGHRASIAEISAGKRGVAAIVSRKSALYFGIIERGKPQAYVRARASSATLCSVHVLGVFLCISISKRESDTYQHVGNSRGGGGQNVLCEFGRGKRTIKCPLQTQFWRPQKVGFVWSVPVSCKENDIA